MEAPVYYISYAVSSMAAISLYSVANEDMARGIEIYRGLVELEDYDAGFLAIIEEAGLPGPFRQDVYEYIYEMF